MKPLLVFACVLVLMGQIASGQETRRDPGPRIELLTMNGSKPNLSPTGEGITSYKIGDLYNRGLTRITLVKPADAQFKIELPIGYTLFNDLIYKVETDAVFTGPTDITFNLPSARTTETFEQLRILYAKLDYADPKVPKWIDATAEEAMVGPGQPWPTEADVRQRLGDFNTRTLHAITPQEEPLIIVVALKDFTKARERLTADLEITGTVPAHKVPHDPEIVKLEVLVNGERICTDNSPESGFGRECVWKPSPGKYKLQTVATDEDGAVGSSEVIEVIIVRP